MTTEQSNIDINSLYKEISDLKSRLAGFESKSNRDLANVIIDASKKKKDPGVKKKRERAIGSEYKKVKENKGIIAGLTKGIIRGLDLPIESEVTKISDNKDIMKKEEKPKRGRKAKKEAEDKPSAPIDIPKVKSEEPKAVPTQMVKSEKELKKERAAERKRLAAEKKKKAAERKSKRTPEQQKKIDERMAKIRASRKAVKKE